MLSTKAVNELSSSAVVSYVTQACKRQDVMPDSSIMKHTLYDTGSCFIYDTFVDSWLQQQATSVIGNAKEREAADLVLRTIGIGTVNYLLKKYVIAAPTGVKGEMYNAALMVPLQRYIRASNILRF